MLGLLMIRGYPTFEKYVKYEAVLSAESCAKKASATHMRHATKQLAESIKKGEVSSSIFTEGQLIDIMNSEHKIENLTWHHHQELGRMQLIPDVMHKKITHVGGMENWGKK